MSEKLKHSDEDIINAVFRIETENSSGTAFLVGKFNKHFLTALHNVNNKKDIYIVVDSKTKIRGRIKQRFIDVDVALIEIEQEINAVPLVLSSNVKSQQKFRVFGYPIKATADWYFGTVSGRDAKQKDIFEIRWETDELIHLKGLSGAPVIDTTTSEVIGIITQHSTKNASLGKLTSASQILDRIQYENSEDKINIYVVMSETEREAESSGRATLKHAVSSASTDSDVKNTSNPIYVYGSDVVKSIDSLKDAVKHMCSSEIVVFDATNNEPAIMFLMGVRSVVRRGITICTIGGEFSIGDAIDFPFNIKEVSFISHSRKQGETEITPFELFKDRIEVGIQQVKSNRYLDLPAFDAVRSLLPNDRNSIPVNDRVLFLCSYSQKYERDNRKSIMRAIKQRVQSNVVERILDLSSPRLVSHKTYEALRRTVLTVVDLTEWRANVLYELGVRTAVNDGVRGTICILEDQNKEFLEKIVSSSDDIDDILKQYLNIQTTNNEFSKIKNRYVKSAQQSLDILNIFYYFEYNLNEVQVGDTNVFRTLKSYHDGQEFPPDYEEKHDLNEIYDIISHHYDAKSEAFARPIFEQLKQDADLLMIDRQTGRNALLYPQNTQLREISDKAIIEKMMAAWGYIDLRYSLEQIRENDQLASVYQILGQELVILLEKEENEKSLIDRIRTSIARVSTSLDDFLENISLLRAKAKDARNNENWDSAISLSEQAIDLLLTEESSDNTNFNEKLRVNLSESYGFLGGIYNRRRDYEKAANSYADGTKYDKQTFNIVNRIINNVLHDVKYLDTEELVIDVKKVISTLKEEIKTSRENDFWAFLDLGILSIISKEDAEAALAYRRFKKMAPEDYAYTTHIRILEQLENALKDTKFSSIANELNFTREDLETQLEILNKE